MNAPTPQRRRRDTDRFEAGPDQTHGNVGKTPWNAGKRRKETKQERKARYKREKKKS